MRRKQEKKVRYSLKKLSVGLVSVAVGYMALCSSVVLASTEDVVSGEDNLQQERIEEAPHEEDVLEDVLEDDKAIDTQKISSSESSQEFDLNNEESNPNAPYQNTTDEFAEELLSYRTCGRIRTRRSSS